MGSRTFRVVTLVLALAAFGCNTTRDDLVLPWVKYRVVKTPGGSGIWSGSSYSVVLVNRWWGWTTAFGETAAPGRPIVIDQSTALVMSSGVAWILRKSDAAPALACGDRKAIASVPPKGGFVDCVDHLAGPAEAVATSLRVRRLDPSGKTVAEHEYSAGDPGRVFMNPAVSFYDDEGRAYLVTFHDPWAEMMPDGSHRSGLATSERLAEITCELIPVGQRPTSVVPAPPGHKIADCSTAVVWSRTIGRRLSSPWGL